MFLHKQKGIILVNWLYTKSYGAVDVKTNLFGKQLQTQAIFGIFEKMFVYFQTFQNPLSDIYTIAKIQVQCEFSLHQFSSWDGGDGQRYK